MIIAIVRVLNEERNIERFCQGYAFADKILIADGGSTDRTIELAQSFDNVKVRDFDVRIELPGDPMGFSNPEPQQVNFCIDWAIEEGADWIILDDCDCWPNPKLRRAAREIIENTTAAMIHVRRLYLWLSDQMFVNLGKNPSLWAWQPGRLDIRYEEKPGSMSSFDSKMVGMAGPRRALAPPYVCLHYFCPNEEIVKMKMERYAAWGYPQVHPLKAFGQRVPLPKELLEE